MNISPQKNNEEITTMNNEDKKYLIFEIFTYVIPFGIWIIIASIFYYYSLSGSLAIIIFSLFLLITPFLLIIGYTFNSIRDLINGKISIITGKVYQKYIDDSNSDLPEVYYIYLDGMKFVISSFQYNKISEDDILKLRVAPKSNKVIKVHYSPSIP